MAKKALDTKNPVFFAQDPRIEPKRWFVPIHSLHVHTLSPFLKTANQKGNHRCPISTADSHTRGHTFGLVSSAFLSLRRDSKVSVELRKDGIWTGPTTHMHLASRFAPHHSWERSSSHFFFLFFFFQFPRRRSL